MENETHFDYDSVKFAEFYGISKDAVENMFDLFFDWREKYAMENSPNTYEENFLIILSFIATSGNYLEIGLDQGVSHRQMVDVRNRLNMGNRIICGIDINPPFFHQPDMVGCKLVWNADSKDAMDHFSEEDNFESIFIDGDHEFEGCAFDICTSWHLVKDGGFISFHDTGKKHGAPGVKKAIDFYKLKNKFEYIEADYKHGVMIIKVDKSKMSNEKAVEILEKLADDD
jgi:hypothetical protein